MRQMRSKCKYTIVHRPSIVTSSAIGQCIQHLHCCAGTDLAFSGNQHATTFAPKPRKRSAARAECDALFAAADKAALDSMASAICLSALNSARHRAGDQHAVAVIMRSAFLEGVGRHDRLFEATPPTNVWQFSERVVMHKGKLSATGSTATAYCWLIWHQMDRNGSTYFSWIPPCRKRFERPEDYA